MGEHPSISWEDTAVREREGRVAHGASEATRRDRHRSMYSAKPHTCQNSQIRPLAEKFCPRVFFFFERIGTTAPPRRKAWLTSSRHYGSGETPARAPASHLIIRAFRKATDES